MMRPSGNGFFKRTLEEMHEAPLLVVYATWLMPGYFGAFADSADVSFD